MEYYVRRLCDGAAIAFRLLNLALKFNSSTKLSLERQAALLQNRLLCAVFGLSVFRCGIKAHKFLPINSTVLKAKSVGKLFGEFV